MGTLGRFNKQPAEVETYTIDYGDDLTAGDNLQSAVSTVTPTGELSIDTTTLIEAPGDHRVRLKLSAGISGKKYKVTVTTTTADGRVLQDEFQITVKEI